MLLLLRWNCGVRLDDDASFDDGRRRGWVRDTQTNTVALRFPRECEGDKTGNAIVCVERENETTIDMTPGGGREGIDIALLFQ